MRSQAAGSQNKKILHPRSCCAAGLRRIDSSSDSGRWTGADWCLVLSHAKATGKKPKRHIRWPLVREQQKRTDITSLQETFEGSATQVAHTELDAWGHCSFLRIACPGQGVRMGEMAE